MGLPVRNAPLPDALIADILRRALREDLGSAGDITSKAIFGRRDCAGASIRAKADGVVAGTYLLKPLYSRLDQRVKVRLLVGDGCRVSRGQELCRLSGPVRSILAGERVALNFLGHLSGIATSTDRLVSLICHTKTNLLDTRKTTPLLRALEKRAVVAGGGTNHRFGLYDMILIKDTHVKAAGGVVAALGRAQTRARRLPLVGVEIEVQTLKEFRNALALEPDMIMLDNMTARAMSACVAIAQAEGRKTKIEASGNVSEKTIRRIAESGVDFVSVGSVTHSAPSLDIHLVVTVARGKARG